MLEFYITYINGYDINLICLSLVPKTNQTYFTIALSYTIIWCNIAHKMSNN